MKLYAIVFRNYSETGLEDSITYNFANKETALKSFNGYFMDKLTACKGTEKSATMRIVVEAEVNGMYIPTDEKIAPFYYGGFYGVREM